MRNFIHINLCVSPILARLTVAIGVILHEGGEGVGPGCRTAAVIMHYLFVVSFMWMLMEGVVLYVTLVKAFITNHKRYMIGFFIFSYGKFIGVMSHSTAKFCAVLQVLPSYTWPCVFPLAWLFPMSLAMAMATYKQPMRPQTLCKPTKCFTKMHCMHIILALRLPL